MAQVAIEMTKWSITMIASTEQTILMMRVYPPASVGHCRNATPPSESPTLPSAIRIRAVQSVDGVGEGYFAVFSRVLRVSSSVYLRYASCGLLRDSRAVSWAAGVVKK